MCSNTLDSGEHKLGKAAWSGQTKAVYLWDTMQPFSCWDKKKRGGGGSELEQVMERDRDGGGGLRNEWGVLEDKG